AGRAAGGMLTASALEPADAEIARRLKLKLGTPVVRLELLRHGDRIPLCAATSWVAAQRFPDAARIYSSTSSITRTLAHFGVRDYVRRSTKAAAGFAEARDSASLKIALGRPILIVDSVDVDGDDCPALTTQARFAADRLELVIET